MDETRTEWIGLLLSHDHGLWIDWFMGGLVMVLSVLLGLPIIAGLLILWLPERYGGLARWMGLLTVLTTLLLSGVIYHGFDLHHTGMQWVEDHVWMPGWMVRYQLGVDGISLGLILLTIYTNLVILLASWTSIRKHVRQYVALFLITQGMLTGLFAATDAILFYIFWEGMLIPMLLMIGLWGGARRSYAAIKFFLYTFLGSVLFLIALMYLGDRAHSFYLPDFYHLTLSWREQWMLFVAFLMAFAVKIPMWPLHTWLPDAHTEAPAGGSALLAALMLKAGAYGFFRFTMPILPMAAHRFSGLMIALALVAIVYVGLVALAQKDVKRLIAYSSIAHMGFVCLGCFAVYAMVLPAHHDMALLALQGASMQMIAHGLSSAALFLGFGMLYDRYHTRTLSDFGGVATRMPVFAAFFLFFILSNIGLPGTAGFVGEFMVIVSGFQVSFWVSATAGLTLIISAVYSLYMMKRVFYGPITQTAVSDLLDIGRLDRLVLWLLVLPVVGLGVYPESLLGLLRPSLEELLRLSLH